LGKAKLQKFEDLNQMPNVFQNTRWDKAVCINHKQEPLDIKDNWRSTVFNNDNPLILELACGKGEYSIGLAQKYPNKNFVGVDIKGNRIWSGAKQAQELNLKNVHFMRTRIEMIHELFAENEVDEIWITFPDPYLSKTKTQKRLTSTRFLKLYKTILKDDGQLHLKTDSQPLYAFTKETIEEEGLTLIQDIPDVYAEANRPAILNIQTYYEKMHLANGLKITYLNFKFP